MLNLSSSRTPQHFFVSYRTTHRGLAFRISDVARRAGCIVDTIEVDLASPYHRGTAVESHWLVETFPTRIVLGCTFMMIASEDASASPWILWEALEGFPKARQIVICWVSGRDPFSILFPLPRYMYRIMHSPQSFIVDARSDSDISVDAVEHILRPTLRYRFMLHLTQAGSSLVCAALLFSPLTILAVSYLLPSNAGSLLRLGLLRPWVCLVCLLLSMIFFGVFYPSYGGPLRLAPRATDRYTRLVAPGPAGPRWNKMLFAVSFVVACTLDGIQLGSISSMSVIGLGTYGKAAILGALLSICYERVRWNLFTVHLGETGRKLEQHYKHYQEEGDEGP